MGPITAIRLCDERYSVWVSFDPWNVTKGRFRERGDAPGDGDRRLREGGTLESLAMFTAVAVVNSTQLITLVRINFRYACPLQC